MVGLLLLIRCLASTAFSVINSSVEEFELVEWSSCSVSKEASVAFTNSLISSVSDETGELSFPALSDDMSSSQSTTELIFSIVKVLARTEIDTRNVLD